MQPPGGSALTSHSWQLSLQVWSGLSALLPAPLMLLAKGHAASCLQVAVVIMQESSHDDDNGRINEAKRVQTFCILDMK